MARDKTISPLQDEAPFYQPDIELELLRLDRERETAWNCQPGINFRTVEELC